MLLPRLGLRKAHPRLCAPCAGHTVTWVTDAACHATLRPKSVLPRAAPWGAGSDDTGGSTTAAWRNRVAIEFCYHHNILKILFY
ncbi:hypothetical protein DVU_3252 [Nitratidesulfovibrio vulgaris str. Hildenborough]|uniref:Uncharacterized protein n=2 Tax=Nitratidesulfovibrio vulgaris TaxID=881 RepID=Q726B3_NITV2|nr:hypothetical protein DVU_3252 [Nitratidesulfovibrio vulgaris str. Hildenborough]ABM27161.1 conserved hypothetical protein [Nitratidesulfovibrio vulgaris DP4]